jgi:hypothetical protein
MRDLPLTILVVMVFVFAPASHASQSDEAPVASSLPYKILQDFDAGTADGAEVFYPKDGVIVLQYDDHYEECAYRPGTQIFSCALDDPGFFWDHPLPGSTQATPNATESPLSSEQILERSQERNPREYTPNLLKTQDGHIVHQTDHFYEKCARGPKGSYSCVRVEGRYER